MGRALRAVNVGVAMAAVNVVQAFRHEHFDLLADQLGRWPAEQIEAVPIGVDDRSAEVDHDHHLRDALEQRPRVRCRLVHDRKATEALAALSAPPVEPRRPGTSRVARTCD